MIFDDFCNRKIIMDLYSIFCKSKGKRKRASDAGGIMVETTRIGNEHACFKTVDSP